MKRKGKLCIIIIALLLFSIVPSRSKAGTFMVGVKGWYINWSSAWDQAFADSLSVFLPGYEITVNPGVGGMTGPLVGYQNDDNTWSLSAAFMLLNTFNVKTDYESAGVALTSDTKMDRRDIDIALSYVLLDWLKAYVGYKYVSAEYDVTLEGSDFYTLKMTAHMPTAGLGLAFPITDSLAFGLQAGVIYVIPEYKFESGGDSTKIKVENGYGVGIEPSLSLLLWDSIMMQLGLRYQIYNVEFKDPDFGMEVSKNDEYFGVTLSAVYLIKM